MTATVHVLDRYSGTGRLLGYSDPFDGPTGLAHAWDAVRGDALQEAGQPRDAKDCRLAHGAIILDWWHDGRWVAYCDTRADMTARLKMNRRLDKADRERFRLRLHGKPRDA